MKRHSSGCIRQVWSSSSPASSGIVARSPRMCSRAETPAPGGWVAWLGWASCWGSPSSTRFRAAPATASTLASDICPASSTNRVSTLAASSCARPQPAGARGHVQLAVAQSLLQLLVTHHRGVRMPVRVVACPPAGRSAAAARLRGRRACSTHGVDEVVDDRVRGPGDADRAAVRDELEDLLGRGVRLPGPRRSLDGQVRIAGANGEPGGRGSWPFRPRRATTRPARAPSSGGRRSSSAVAASWPLTPSRTTRSPSPAVARAAPGVGRAAFDQSRGQRPRVVLADLQIDRPVPVVHRPD